jgi:hypothetical protein
MSTVAKLRDCAVCSLGWNFAHDLDGGCRREAMRRAGGRRVEPLKFRQEMDARWILSARMSHVVGAVDGLPRQSEACLAS